MRRDQPAFGQKIIARPRIEDRVRQSQVGQRIGDERAQPQLLARRPAEVGDPAPETVLIVWPFVVRREPAQSDRVIELVRRTGTGQRSANRGVRSSFETELARRIAITALRENLDYAGQRARSVKRALRSTHDLDSIDIVRRQIGEVEGALQSLIDWNAIEQHLGVLAAQTTGENRSQRARRTRLNHRNAGHLAKCIRDAMSLFDFEIIRANDVDRCR